ncbi:LmeA family phospholipid-binding protein [Micromonospora echinofusca]|uniref:LmeA family phospholipid-binding protein n=1 Tax=Micromonospora echinofusca TaxID=47858 RepID=A0ABS3VVQ7_MICEH|nr:DUF2993 domain-containing protein [Micromonospora echinofusca]MBO4208604.1 LmeA family phospholipid-binding protein [Micromonospora echinofusca]
MPNLSRLPRRLPRNRWARLGALLLVVVLGLLLVGDRIAARLAGDRLAERLACAAGLDRRPEVRIGGFPFATQLLTGRFTEVHAEATDLHLGELRVRQVDAVLRDLTLPAAGQPVRVGRLTIGLVLDYAALPDRLGGREVRYAERDGQLVVSTETQLLGRQVPVTLLARPEIVDGQLRITPGEVEVMGFRRPAEQVLKRMGGATELTRPLPQLPANLRYRSVRATGDGLRVELGGTDVTAQAAGAATDRSGRSDRGAGTCGGA